MTFLMQIRWNVFNRCLPIKTTCLKREKYSGGKRVKDQLTTCLKMKDLFNGV